MGGEQNVFSLDKYITYPIAKAIAPFLGDMYFNKTLNDWAKFDINNRTSHDASISTGLAIMACNKNKYRPNPKLVLKSYDLGIKKYDNKGQLSKIID